MTEHGVTASGEGHACLPVTGLVFGCPLPQDVPFADLGEGGDEDDVGLVVCGVTLGTVLELLTLS